MDGKRKSYCTPEAYHGDTCWLFRNRGNGTFEDVTAKSGIFDPTSKSLGVALLDYDHDGWPDVLIANDTQPNKLYRNLRNGTFEDVAVRAGVAFSEDGKARAGMGVDAADFDNSGVEGIAITNFDNEMMALYRPARPGTVRRCRRARRHRARLRATASGSDAPSSTSIWMAASTCWRSTATSTRPSASIHGNAGYAQPPHLFLNHGRGRFQDVAAQAGGGFADPQGGARPGVRRFRPRWRSRPADHHQSGPGVSVPQRRQLSGARSLRLRLTGTKSNRDAIGAVVHVTTPEGTQSRMVKTGSSYLSQSELTLTFGLGPRGAATRVVVEWPSGQSQEFRDVRAGEWQCVEGSLPKPSSR